MTTTAGTKSISLTHKAIEDLLKLPSLVIHWDDRWRTNWAEWKDGEASSTAWYDDRRSLEQKLLLMQAYHLKGFAAWRLGMEDPAFWSLALDFEPKPAKPRFPGAEGQSDRRCPSHDTHGRSDLASRLSAQRGPLTLNANRG